MKEIAAVFLRLGLLGFGGPVAVMAMIEQETCLKRGWLTAAEFREIYAVCKLLPGPVATQMAIYIGQVRGGIRGGLIAGCCFILPAFLMVLSLSYFYVHSGAVAKAGGVIVGLQAAALAIILVSTWSFCKPYRSSHRAWAIVAFSAGVIYFHSNWEPLVILGFGAIGVFLASRGARQAVISKLHAFAWIPAAHAAAVAVTRVVTVAASDSATLMRLFMMCFKAGFLVFGTGLAVVPVLEGDAVTRFAWLTHSQFMDGLALGQITPGPLTITATFVGYVAAGMPGALAATFGMFLPAFFNVLVLVPRVWKRFSGTPGAAGFSSYAIPAVIGGILGTTVKLAMFALAGPVAIGTFAAALVCAVIFKPPAWLLIPGAGVAGGLLTWVAG